MPEVAAPPVSSPAPAPAAPTWTKSQLDAIETVDRSVLVSAAAGSGKTSVLSQRCLHLLENHGCNIDELLVVTFTEAAAGEMRTRIEAAISKRADDPKAGGEVQRQLQTQMTRMPRAQISTLHGFCSRLIRQNFHILGLDPQFTLLDAEAASLLLEETATDLFEERYVQDRFRVLMEQYSGADDRVLRAVIRVHEVLRSVVDPAGWRQKALRDITEAGQKPLRDSALGAAYLARLCEAVSEAVAIAEHAVAQVASTEATAAHRAYVQQLLTAAQDICDALASGDAAAARDIQKSLPRQPSIPKNPAWDPLRQALEPIKACLCGTKATILKHFAFSEPFLRQGMKKTLPAAQELLELVGLLEGRYAAAKRDANSFDFGDLERFALQLLRDSSTGGPSAVARECHRRFKHVLVDEYQDINQLQDEILRLVSRECIASEGAQANLFCVGDVKQSIYRFRLAEPNRFLQRRDDFESGRRPEGRSITLNENFRSRGPLLEAINDVFRNLMRSRRMDVIYGDSESLKPGAKFEANHAAFAGAPIELHVIDENDPGDDAETPSDAVAKAAADEAAELTRSEREARHVASLIHDLMGHGDQPRRIVYDSKKQTYRDINYGDIVILLRAMSGTANVYVRQLLELGIPAFAESRGGFFEAVEIRDLLALLAIIDNARQDIPLAAILRSPLAAIDRPEDCLADIRLFADAQPHHTTFHEAAESYAHTDQAWAKPVAKLFDNLAAWRQLALLRPVDELLWSIFEDTGYCAFCAALPRGDQRLANLYELHRRARDFAATGEGLSRFLALLADAAVRGRVGEAVPARVGEGTVQIMTVHASKGLEFPVVICPDLGRRFNMMDCRGAILLERDIGLGLEVVDQERQVRYDSLATCVLAAKLRDASMAEELRVLYVAMTRAKEHLILLGSAGGETLQKWQARGQSHPLTDENILCAGCTLQWLYTLAHGSARSAFEVHPVTPAAIPAPREPAALPPPAAAQSETARAADEIINRITGIYPHLALTTRPAAQSVTALSKSELADRPVIAGADEGDVVDGVSVAPAGFVAAAQGTLEVPSFATSAQAGSDAADRGTATHALLQHLNLNPPPRNLCDLQTEISRIVAARHLTPAQAHLVDGDCILWWLQTDLGRLLSQHAKDHLRELPFYLATPADSAATNDPLDLLMVRGRMDAVLTLPGRTIIIDYKTDRQMPEEGSTRLEGYRRQCGYYRQAAEGLGLTGDLEVYLVFLTARQILAVKPEPVRS